MSFGFGVDKVHVLLGEKEIIMSKRQENVKKLEKKYLDASKIVNDGDWSQEAIDRATSARMVWAGYKVWVDSNPPAGATHPTEEYL